MGRRVMKEQCVKHTLEVWGSAAKPYKVSIATGIPSCSCPAYAIGKNRSLSSRPDVRPGVPWCKHLEAQFDKLCRWVGEPLVPGLCDNCGSPTEPYNPGDNDE